jgi:hypothetical protein
LQFQDKFYQQKKGMAIRNSQSLVISNIFMEHFEEIELDTADHKPTKSLRYVDTSVVWPHGPAILQQFLCHLNNIGPTFKFTTEVEANQNMSYVFNCFVEILLILAYDLCSVEQTMNDSPFYVM